MKQYKIRRFIYSEVSHYNFGKPVFKNRIRFVCENPSDDFLALRNKMLTLPYVKRVGKIDVCREGYDFEIYVFKDDYEANLGAFKI